jgi:hypothetical protein
MKDLQVYRMKELTIYQKAIGGYFRI